MLDLLSSLIGNKSTPASRLLTMVVGFLLLIVVLLALGILSERWAQ